MLSKYFRFNNFSKYLIEMKLSDKDQTFISEDLNFDHLYHFSCS